MAKANQAAEATQQEAFPTQETKTSGTGFKFKVKSHVTVPLLKVPDNGTPIYVTFDSKIEKAKENESVRTRKANLAAAGEQVQEAPHVARVINLETGEHQQIIVNSVLKTEIEDKYPDNGYIGVSFEIKKFKMQGGKKYATFQIAEIEIES